MRNGSSRRPPRALIGRSWLPWPCVSYHGLLQIRTAVKCSPLAIHNAEPFPKKNLCSPGRSALCNVAHATGEKSRNDAEQTNLQPGSSLRGCLLSLQTVGVDCSFIITNPASEAGSVFFSYSAGLNFKMSVFQQYLKVINEYVATSTFGRVFRLQGCGHVSSFVSVLRETECSSISRKSRSLALAFSQSFVPA